MIHYKRLFHRRFLQGVVLVVGSLLLLDIATYLLAERQWFQELGYQRVFLVRLGIQGSLGLLVAFISAGFLLGNLALAQQLAWATTSSETDRLPLPGRMRLRSLLPLTLGFSLIISILLVYHGQVAIQHWHPQLDITPNGMSLLPSTFGWASVWRTVQQFIATPPLDDVAGDNVTQLMLQLGRLLMSPVLQLGILLGLAIALMIVPQVLLGAIAILASLSFGLVLSEHWADILLYFYPAPFNAADPLFEQNISFYIFKLPFWELLQFWLVGLFVLAFFSIGLIYLLSGNSLSQGRFAGFSYLQQRHLYGLGSTVMLALALSYWLDRYKLLYSNQGVSYGASYTSIAVQLPAYTVLSIAAIGIALPLMGRACLWRKQVGRFNPQQSPAIPSRRPILPLLLSLYLIVAVCAGNVLPTVVQQLIVQPNELELERPFIERSIAFTRQAFDLGKINVETFNPQNQLTYSDIQANELTVTSIRIWDKRPLLESNRQLQRIRSYYEFPDADLDRYMLLTEDGSTELRQVLIAARELDYNSVPQEAKTWLNKHLIYTHGYGFTVSPVNVASGSGLPDYFIRGIEQIPSSPQIQASFPAKSPRIYYGELTNTYVMTHTQVRELDYPSGSDNVYNTYDGQGGIQIGSIAQRFLFAKHLRDWRMLLTDTFTPDTRLLFRRNISQRVRAIAPFLHYDTDPYLVIADVNGEQTSRSVNDQSAPNYLYWIIDAYTTSDRFPYSDPLSNPFNYIRNSVKVVVDAYNGSVQFYVADPDDPIIQAWSRVFPGMFRSLSDMPPNLRSHIRYPQDFYQVQSQQLMTYHMTDPQVFYNREDQWRAPNEIYGSEQQLVEPYYLILNLPDTPTEEFILLRPFTPAQRNNLIAWLAARSDGAQYGTMLLYNFPKQELVFGPEQLEARINQDPVISQQISLWNRQGSRAIQGNLLVIPIEQSLIYVEPLYIEAEQNQLPILARVIAAYGDRIVMAETLEQALQAVFRSETEAPAIIRPIEQPATTAQ